MNKKTLTKMKTIEERAYEHYPKQREFKATYRCGLIDGKREGYILGATEQKAIDDAELARLKKAWEKEAEVNHDADKAYKQGRHDAIDKACEWLRARNVLTEESIKGFRKAMEE